MNQARSDRSGIFSFSIIALLFISCVAHPFSAHAAGNLITNPTFAAGATSSPTSWNSSSWGDATGAVFTYPVAGEDDNFAAEVSISSYKDAGENNGAAEWYFNNVSVSPGAVYSFSDWYKSTAPSYLMAQWTLTDGTLAYDAIETLPSTNNVWENSPVEVFNAPLNAASVTILHLLQSVGTLTVDNYSLTPYVPGAEAGLSQSLVSLTFDDGWTSQYTNALPVLKAANVDGSFYIITQDMINATAAAGENLFTTSEVSTSPITTSSTATWGDVYTDPTYQQYIFSDSYTATAASTISASYTLSGKKTSLVLGTVPAGTSVADFSFTLPTTGGNTVTPISISQTLSGSGTLTASNPSITEYQPYMTAAQVLSFQSAGDEMDSHTETHPDLTALTTAQATTEISGSRTALLNAGISPATDFAYPFGNYSPSLEQLVTNAGFTAGRSVDVGYNNAATNPLELKSYSVVEGTTFDMVKNWIDTAHANNWWLILTFHDIDPANIIASNNEVYGTTPQILQQIISYIQSQNIPIETMNNALAIANGNPPPPPPPPTATSTLAVSIVNNGGTSTPADFILTVKNGTSTVFQGPASSNQSYVLNVGTTYTVQEATTTNSLNYSVSLGGTCSGTVANSNPITCAITNTYNPVQPPPPPPPLSVSIIPTSLAGGAVNSSYSETLTASTTGTGTFTWSLSSGSLPPGLKLKTSGNKKTTTVSGTPTTRGTYIFTVGVVVQTGTASASTTQSYTVTIARRGR